MLYAVGVVSLVWVMVGDARQTNYFVEEGVTVPVEDEGRRRSSSDYTRQC